jgi:hypothetical protein
MNIDSSRLNLHLLRQQPINHHEYPNEGKEHEAEGRREIEVHIVEGSYFHPHKRLRSSPHERVRKVSPVKFMIVHWSGIFKQKGEIKYSSLVTRIANKLGLMENSLVEYIPGGGHI